MARSIDEIIDKVNIIPKLEFKLFDLLKSEYLSKWHPDNNPLGIWYWLIKIDNASEGIKSIVINENTLFNSEHFLSCRSNEQSNIFERRVCIDIINEKYKIVEKYRLEIYIDGKQIY